METIPSTKTLSADILPFIGGVRILNKKRFRRSDPAEERATASLDIKSGRSGAVLMISGNAQGSFDLKKINEDLEEKLSPTNAGIELQLVAIMDGKETLLARDQSFEGEASSITFFASSAVNLDVDPHKDVRVEARAVSIGGVFDEKQGKIINGGADHNDNVIAEVRVLAIPIVNVHDD